MLMHLRELGVDPTRCSSRDAPTRHNLEFRIFVEMIPAIALLDLAYTLFVKRNGNIIAIPVGLTLKMRCLRIRNKESKNRV